MNIEDYGPDVDEFESSVDYKSLVLNDGSLNRNQKIGLAKKEIVRLLSLIKPLEKQLYSAENALKDAQRSFDIGSEVLVQETCSRRCCIEKEYSGEVLSGSINQPGFYNVKITKSKDLSDIGKTVSSNSFHMGLI